MNWRTGRHVGRTIYRQKGDVAGDDDELIGLMDTPGLADLVVASVNGTLVPGVDNGLEDDIRFLMNYYSVDSKTNTPDFILAAFVVDVLKALETTSESIASFNAGTSI